MANQLHRNIIFSYTNRLTSLLGTRVLVPLYTRFLGQQLFGEWIVITTIATYLTLANIGIDQALTNRIAEAAAKGRRQEVDTLISTAFFAYSAVGAIVLAVFARLSSPLSALFMAGS